jgi:hypothetical protein
MTEQEPRAKEASIWRRLIVIVTSVIALSLVGVAQGSTTQVLPPTSKQYGKTYAAWSAAWWQWALAIPVHAPPFSDRVNHPLVDLTGAKCGVGQSGPVWFLGAAFFPTGSPASSTIVRDGCTVPKSKALFFPLLNTECSTLEGPDFGCASTEQGLRDAVKSAIDGASGLAADVDGVPITITSDFRVGSPAKPTFCFTLPPDDVLTAIGEGPYSPGTYCPAVDDGYYVMLAPLPAGTHTIHFHGEIPAFNFTLDVTYHLTVS